MSINEKIVALLCCGTAGIDRWNRFRAKARATTRRDLEKDLYAELEQLGLDLGEFDAPNLTGVNLAEANLQNADLSRSFLERANLRGANLAWANLEGASLSGADLEGAILVRANLDEARLGGANLKNALLMKSHVAFADLKDAVVENADVTDAVFYFLRGLPSPPRRLRVQRDGTSIHLSGADSADFFVVRAVVEVYLTRQLTSAEIWLFQYHLLAIRESGEVYGVEFVAPPRSHDGGTVLRFQGQTYEAIYAALPYLLIPFRTASAIDWKGVHEAIPKEDRPKPHTEVVNAETQVTKEWWVIAERLAQSFEGFADARVVRLTEGRNKGVSITVATDETMIAKVAWAMLPPTARNAAMVFNGPTTLQGGQQVGDNYNQKGNFTGTATGPGASVSVGGSITATVSQTTSPALAELTGVVKQALELLADTPLTKADREKAEKHVEDIQTEAKKTPPDKESGGKIQGWLDSLAKWCEPAAKLIAGAKMVAAAVKVWADSITQPA